MAYTKPYFGLGVVVALLLGFGTLVAAQDDDADCSRMKDTLTLVAPAVTKCIRTPVPAGGSLRTRINCRGKCLFTEMGLFGSDGQLNLTVALDYAEKASKGRKPDPDQSANLQKCVELTLDFEPENCDSYGPFFQCLMQQMEGRMTSRPQMRHCLTKLRGDRNSPLSTILSFVRGGEGGGLLGGSDHGAGVSRGGLLGGRNRGGGLLSRILHGGDHSASVQGV